MRSVSWLVFLAFIGLSSYANYRHGDDAMAGFLLATVPVGFAVVIFIYEALHAKNRVTGLTTAAAMVVGGGAGVASYLGLFGMAREHGVQLVPALLLPLAFDGVVAVASMGIRAFASPADIPTILSAGTVPGIIPATVPSDPPAIPHDPPAILDVPAVRDDEDGARDGRGDGVPGSPYVGDAAILVDMYGSSSLPSQAAAKKALGWGSSRVSAAYRAVKASTQEEVRA